MEPVKTRCSIWSHLENGIKDVAIITKGLQSEKLAISQARKVPSLKWQASGKIRLEQLHVVKNVHILQLLLINKPTPIFTLQAVNFISPTTDQRGCVEETSIPIPRSKPLDYGLLHPDDFFLSQSLI